MKGREVMAAALVDVDEVRVEAIEGEAEGVKVRPEVSCFFQFNQSARICAQFTSFHEQFELRVCF